MAHAGNSIDAFSMGPRSHLHRVFFFEEIELLCPLPSCEWPQVTLTSYLLPYLYSRVDGSCQVLGVASFNLLVYVCIHEVIKAICNYYTTACPPQGTFVSIIPRGIIGTLSPLGLHTNFVIEMTFPSNVVSCIYGCLPASFAFMRYVCAHLFSGK